jgi:hypothetical protein
MIVSQKLQGSESRDEPEPNLALMAQVEEDHSIINVDEIN